MAISFPDLPYPKDALEPHMSAETFDYHHGKHHKTYVDKANAAIEGTDLADKDVVDIIKAAHAAGNNGLFNSAAQAWNHDFFWKCLSPEKKDIPADLKADIEASFGSVDAFKEEFSKAAAGQFGSGWAWLVKDSGKLRVMSTGNAETPLTEGVTPLATLDVWEHAYYIDFRNDRPGFIKTYLDTLINWDFVAENNRAA